MPFYPVLYHHHIINRQTPFTPITLNPIRISRAKFIKAQTVLINIGNLQQIVYQHQIIGRTHRAFENTVLYTLSVFHACLRHQTKTTLPLRGFRTHIVRNHNHHGFSPPISQKKHWRKRLIIFKITFLKQSHNIIDLITEPGTTVCRFKVWRKLLPQCAPRRIGLRREIAHQFDCIGWTVLDSLLTQDAFLEIVGKRQQPSNSSSKPLANLPAP